MTQINEPALPDKTIDVANIIRACRTRIASEYVRAGDSAALVATACASILLQAHVEAGSLRQDALDQLVETTDNLGIPDRLGADIVDAFLDAGPSLYDIVADIWARHTIPAVAA
jgi:hypothetical protein